MLRAIPYRGDSYQPWCKCGPVENLREKLDGWKIHKQSLARYAAGSQAKHATATDLSGGIGWAGHDNRFRFIHTLPMLPRPIHETRCWFGVPSCMTWGLYAGAVYVGAYSFEG